jgi:Tfp pilus assembly protein PilO
VKGTDRIVLLSVGIVALLAAFYLMVLSPKREKASQLDKEITQLTAEIDQQELVATFAEQARQDFPRYYGQLVVLGKAVPDQADQASTIVQLSQIASRTGVDFRSIKVTEGGAAPTATAATAPATTAPATTTPPADGTSTPAGTATTTTPSDGTTTTPSDGSTPPADGSAAGSTAEAGTAAAPATTTAAPAPATEAAAASLPIGASVGPAGLPILPYDLSFQGTFFDIANFMAGVDSLVHLGEGSGQIAANGRLLTVDGFSLKPLPTLSGEQELKATFTVTTYVVPSDQGLTAGASPTGPSASPLQPEATPASTTTPTVTP